MKRLGFLYGIIHCCIEIICFFLLSRCFSDNASVLFLWAFVFDFLAFVPQGLIGVLYDRKTKIRIDLLAVFCFICSIITSLFEMKLFTMLFMCIGNMILHETGAVITANNSNGKLAPSAIFVAGGSFGLITGQTLGKTDMSVLWLFVPVIVIVIILLLTIKKYLYRENSNFDIVNEKINKKTIVFAVLFIVAMRSLISYAIPISWKKELWQAFLLFFIMGLGKALGGVLSDKFGSKNIGIVSTILCIPFLIAGENMMVISVIGVFLFSMTMSITFTMLLSLANNKPGVSFGITTVGLFLGVMPMFFIPNIIKSINIILIITGSIICAVLFKAFLKNNEK